jgi:hypothetical protein
LKKLRRIGDNNNFEVLQPDKAILWHPTKNGKKKPNEFLPKSNKIVWWRCHKGHDWENRISHMTEGVPCPFCTNKRVHKDYNFGVLHPDKIHLWHPTKNKPLKSFDILPGSDKKFWWKCKNGHEWEARVANISKGKSCQKCNRINASKRRILIGVKNSGSLAEMFPGLMNEWHPKKNSDVKPNEISVGSAIKVWWICSQGHEWPAQVRNRCRGIGCPNCNPQISKLELRISTELMSIFPTLETQIHFNKFTCDILIREHNLAIEIDGFPWHEGTEARDKSKSDRIEKSGFKVIRVRDERLKSLSGNEVIFGRRETPLSIIKKTLSFIQKVIKLNENQTQLIEEYLLTSKYLNNRDYLLQLATIHFKDETRSLNNYPKLLVEWHSEKNHPLLPSNFPAGSNKKVWWKCKNGHEWKASIGARTRGRGCNVCAQSEKGEKYKKLAVAKNGSLTEKFPGIAKEWHPIKNQPLLPSHRSSGSHEKVWWICEKGHEWPAIINSRTSSGCGCPYCKGKLATLKTSLASVHPDLAAEWHPTKNEGLTPVKVLPGSNKKVWWICPMGHEYSKIIRRRTKGGSGCQKCSDISNNTP